MLFAEAASVWVWGGERKHEGLLESLMFAEQTHDRLLKGVCMDRDG
jgi:hypothetical protein